MTKVIGFSCECYVRNFHSDNYTEYKNIIALEEMTPRQRYELALEDSEDAMIWDSVSNFLNDMNDGIIDENNMFFYEYNV